MLKLSETELLLDRMLHTEEWLDRYSGFRILTAN